MRRTQIFAGSSHPVLVEKICDWLGKKRGEVELGKFANGETRVQIKDSIRNQDVFIIQSGSNKINDSVIELLIMVSACKGGSAKSITAVLPYFPYCRQSKKKSHRGAITARMIANLLVQAGADHVITIDLHASQMQGFFQCPVDNLVAEPLLARWIRHHVKGWEEGVVVSKNPGGTKRVTSLADALKLNFGIVTTERRRTHRPHQSLEFSAMAGEHGFFTTVHTRETSEKSFNGDKSDKDKSDDNEDVPAKPLDKEKSKPTKVDGEHETEEGYAADEERPTSSASASGQTPSQYATHARNGSSSNRATSGSRKRLPIRTSTEIPPSPLSKSALPGSSPIDSPSLETLVRARTDPPALPSFEEEMAEEFTDERAKDVTIGRLVQGHIVPEDYPSPVFSSVSGSVHGRARGFTNDDDDLRFDPMAASFMSTVSSLRHDASNHDALGGSADAGASSEEEEEDLRNPDLETTVTLVGNVRDRPVFIVDDMIDKAGSWVAAAETVVKRGGATSVYCMATHGLFGEDSLMEMEQCECIEKIIVTNSFPIDAAKQQGITKLVQLDVAPLLSEAIRRNHHGENISQLYMHLPD